jgi:hypothetical protein
MRKLEDPEYSEAHGSLHIGMHRQVAPCICLSYRPSLTGQCSLLHQVPISGLCMGNFCRLEYECKTVLELWETCEPPIGEPDEQSTSESHLHSAIAACDWQQMQSLLANPATNINVQDVRGWTALHLACSTMESFKVCSTQLILIKSIWIPTLSISLSLSLCVCVCSMSHLYWQCKISISMPKHLMEIVRCTLLYDWHR